NLQCKKALVSSSPLPDRQVNFLSVSARKICIQNTRGILDCIENNPGSLELSICSRYIFSFCYRSVKNTPAKQRGRLELTCRGRRHGLQIRANGYYLIFQSGTKRTDTTGTNQPILVAQFEPL